MVTLRPLSDEEFARWLPTVEADYAKGMARYGGLSTEAARVKAREDTERLFPGGRRSADQFVFALDEGGVAVGHLWVAERMVGFRRVLWVFEVAVDEEHRGRGLGRAAMGLAEAEARRRGLDRVALNVFGGNATARGLYRTLGYSENAVQMSKVLA